MHLWEIWLSRSQDHTSTADASGSIVNLRMGTVQITYLRMVSNYMYLIRGPAADGWSIVVRTEESDSH